MDKILALATMVIDVLKISKSAVLTDGLNVWLHYTWIAICSDEDVDKDQPVEFSLQSLKKK